MSLSVTFLPVPLGRAALRAALLVEVPQVVVGRAVLAALVRGLLEAVKVALALALALIRTTREKRVVELVVAVSQIRVACPDRPQSSCRLSRRWLHERQYHHSCLTPSFGVDRWRLDPDYQRAKEDLRPLT
jgi:hypothetical protein